MGAGLTTDEEGAPFLLEASQGDRITGRIARSELASLVQAALVMPEAAGALNGWFPCAACATKDFQHEAHAPCGQLDI